MLPLPEPLFIGKSAYSFNFLLAQFQHRHNRHCDRVRVAAKERGAHRPVEVLIIVGVDLGQKEPVEFTPCQALFRFDREPAPDIIHVISPDERNFPDRIDERVLVDRRTVHRTDRPRESASGIIGLYLPRNRRREQAVSERGKLPEENTGLCAHHRPGYGGFPTISGLPRSSWRTTPGNPRTVSSRAPGSRRDRR